MTTETTYPLLTSTDIRRLRPLGYEVSETTFSSIFTRNTHITQLVQYYPRTSNDCYSEELNCTCGLHSRSQEGGGDWQGNKDVHYGHSFDRLHSAAYLSLIGK